MALMLILLRQDDLALRPERQIALTSKLKTTG